MDDGFECSCPAEYKGPTCQGKFFIIITELSTFQKMNTGAIPFGSMHTIILELVSLTCLAAVFFP